MKKILVIFCLFSTTIFAQGNFLRLDSINTKDTSWKAIIIHNEDSSADLIVKEDYANDPYIGCFSDSCYWGSYFNKTVFRVTISYELADPTIRDFDDEKSARAFYRKALRCKTDRTYHITKVEIEKTERFNSSRGIELL